MLKVAKVKRGTNLARHALERNSATEVGEINNIIEIVVYFFSFTWRNLKEEIQIAFYILDVY
jgi:hypothetical protein